MWCFLIINFLMCNFSCCTLRHWFGSEGLWTIAFKSSQRWSKKYNFLFPASTAHIWRRHHDHTFWTSQLLRRALEIHFQSNVTIYISWTSDLTSHNRCGDLRYCCWGKMVKYICSSSKEWVPNTQGINIRTILAFALCMLHQKVPESLVNIAHLEKSFIR